MPFHITPFSVLFQEWLFKKPNLVIFLASILLNSTSYAQNEYSIEVLLQEYDNFADRSCENLKTLEGTYILERKLAEANAVNGTVKIMCGCVPKKLREIEKSLSTEEKQTHISESVFLARYKPLIIDKCIAEQLKSIYQNDCTNQFKTFKKDSNKYCSCMNTYLENISDEKAYKISVESFNHIPKAAEAKRNGQKEPEKPPALKKFMDIENSCSM